MRLWIALLAAVTTLAAADTLARVADAVFATPHSYDVPRNPHFRRGWRAYTEPRPRPPRVPLVVVISNSQGFLREHPDGELVWPARLEALLGAGDDGRVIVANWSVAGGQAPEMIVLAARAAQHRPDLVVLVSGSANFSPKWADHPLSFWLSDATRLAYLPSVRRLLPAEFLERTRAHDPAEAFAAWSGLGRSHARFFEERDEAWSWRPEAPTRFGELAGRFLDARGERFTLGVGRGEGGLSSEPTPIDAEHAEGSARLLRQFEHSLRGASPDTALLVVGMPMARPQRAGAGWRDAARFVPLARDVLGDLPRTQVIDAREEIPAELFVHATHLRPEGHARLARWMLPHVRRALGAS